MKKMNYVLIVLGIILFGTFINEEKGYATYLPDSYVINREIDTLPYSYGNVPGTTIYVQNGEGYKSFVNVSSIVDDRRAAYITRLITGLSWRDYTDMEWGVQSDYGIISSTTPYLFNVTYYNYSPWNIKVKETIMVNYKVKF